MRMPGRPSQKEWCKRLGIPYEEPKEVPQEKPRKHRPAMSYLNVKKTITPRNKESDENFSEKE